MKLKFLALTVLMSVFSYGAYSQITYGKPVSRAFSGKTQGGKTGLKPSVGKISQGNTTNSNSNTSSAAQFTSEQISKANTAKDASYLTQAEKDVILYCNLARLDGPTFINQYLGKLKGSSNSYEKSLLEDLATIKNLPMLKPNSKLAKAAKYHVDDIGPKGLVQHESSDGTNCGNRVRKYYKGGYIGENIDFGPSAAMDIVLDLLIDQDVESLGHRKNILNLNFTRIGVSIGAHKEYRNSCVQDLADSAGDTEDNNVKPHNNNNNNNNNVTPNRPSNDRPNNDRPNNNRYDDDEDDDYDDEDDSHYDGDIDQWISSLFDDDDYCDDVDDYYSDDYYDEEEDYFDDDDCNYYDEDDDYDYYEGWDF